MVQQFIDGLARNAHDLFLIAALLAFLLALFIVLAAGLRLLEFLFPSLARWLDEHVGPDPVWDDE